MNKTSSLIVKIVLLALATSVLGFMSFLAFLAGDWIIGLVLAAIILVMNYVYLAKKPVASKFFFPGTIFLILFMLIPVVYTISISAQNFKTGNLISKEEALDNLISTGLTNADTGVTYDMIFGEYKGQTAMLLTNQFDGTVSIAFGETNVPLEEGKFSQNEFGVAETAEGFTKIDLENNPDADEILNAVAIPIGNGVFIAPQGIDIAADMVESYSYDAEKNQLLDISTGQLWIDNGKGNFVNAEDPQEKLYPGWRTLDPAGNYLGLLTDPRLSGPFLSVFTWTLTFSILTVGSMFFVGFLLAVVLDKKIRGRNIYRGILILPYAMPSFMSILIWAGMFNREIGVINTLLGTQVDWLNDPWLAKLALLIVNLWLGFPYFYLISTGALQALPSDIEEAASIDGASNFQTFFQIKLPLVLEILAPLLIASLAFNFNNFNLVYLLTRGGPINAIEGETAGATDILITYAYKTAFTGTEQNFGLASAISVVVFLIVGALSLWSLRQSKVLEENR